MESRGCWCLRQLAGGPRTREPASLEKIRELADVRLHRFVCHRVRLRALLDSRLPGMEWRQGVKSQFLHSAPETTRGNRWWHGKRDIRKCANHIYRGAHWNSHRLPG